MIRKFLMAAVIICMSGMSACSNIPKIPAKGLLQGFPIQTTVDDERAKYYLENYLAGKWGNDTLQRRFEALHAELQNDLPSRQQLKRIASEFSIDLGALVFGNQLLKQPGNADLQKKFLENLERIRSGTAEYPRKDVLVMIVPGFDYEKHGSKTGADFARPRLLLEKAGYEVYFVKIDPVGSVEDNAAYLSKCILENKGRKIALAGASSAGPAIHLALGKNLADSDLVNVKAWLNLGGILQGVPVLDQVSSGPKGLAFSAIRWFMGWPKASFESMSIQVSRKRFASLSVPKGIRIYNYVGLSLSGNISDFARDKYLMMRGDGPNDGLTLLPDIIAPNSRSILSMTTDHFFAQDPEIDHKTLALLITILGEIAD